MPKPDPYDGRSEDPEQPARRKLQMTGGSTYTVSLPKTWAKAHALEPGMGVDVFPRPGWVAIRLAETDRHPPSVSIDATTRDPDELVRWVTAAYIAGSERISIESIENGDQRTAVRNAIRGLVGIEIQEETETTIEAWTMLDIHDLSAVQTINQMELMSVDMHEKAIHAAISGDRDLATAVASKDDNIDRLFALICRIFQRSVVNISIPIQQNGLSTFEFYSAARQLERVADHAEKIANTAQLIESSPPEDLVSDIDQLGAESREIVERSLASLLEKHNSQQPNAIFADGQSTIDAAQALDRRMYEVGFDDAYLYGTVVDSIIRTTEYGLNIAELAVQASLRETPRGRTAEVPIDGS